MFAFVVFFQIKWLMYWVVYAIFASVESIADMFVAW